MRQIIPLAAAVICESCLCITASTGHRCDCCGSTAPYSVQRILEKLTEAYHNKPLTGIEKHFLDPQWELDWINEEYHKHFGTKAEE